MRQGASVVGRETLSHADRSRRSLGRVDCWRDRTEQVVLKAEDILHEIESAGITLLCDPGGVAR